ncbi:MAG: 2-iminoacetate synthase ThiH [Candidatus Cloacimonadota bacterium]|nr:MAG: 2-iminoacetate synthase ThiH [Candidatus Cloacimonadota bacterium]PIE79330.1 MAG: 2-iminoacetate synthase ThiH [Candidatus Delongbacteria bacterium]
MFYDIFDIDLVRETIALYSNPSDQEILDAINGEGFSLERAAILLSDRAENFLEQMAERSKLITRQRFGNIVSVFTPMYLNNLCVNGCLYCGFNSGLKNKRIRLTIDQCVAESEEIKKRGIDQILLVAGEDPKGITPDYISEFSSRIKSRFSSIGIELQPYELDDYKKMKKAGVDYVAFYQETYNQDLYKIYHPKGPKSDYKRRINNLDIIGKAGMSKIGMGFLLGLADFKEDMLSLISHMAHIYKNYTFSQISVSFPRIQPSESTPIYNSIIKKYGITPVNEITLARAMFIVRLLFNDAGITLSTRESDNFRDNMTPLVVTQISAASKTAPGAYIFNEENLDQFTIQDDRSLGEIKEMLRRNNLESVMYERQYEKD